MPSEEAQKEYPLVFYDFTEDEISNNKEWYFDASHFNYYGAIQFTQILNGMLKELWPG